MQKSSTLLQNFGTYFSALADACDAMTNTTVGEFYSAVVEAEQTALSAECSATNTLITSALAKQQSFDASVLSAGSSYNASVLSAYDDYYDAILSTLETDYSTTLTNEQLAIAAECDYYDSVLAASYEQERATRQAQTDATLRKLACIIIRLRRDYAKCIFK